MVDVELGTSVIQRSSLIDRTLEEFKEQFNITPSTPTALETFLTAGTSGGIFDLQAPKLSTDLFQRFNESLSSILTGFTQERQLLGEASIDISQALSEQVTIREQQRVFDQEALRNTQLALGEINERVSRQLIELGNSFSGISTGGFDPIKFFTDNPIIGGIGIGGLLVGGVVLLLVLR